MENIKNKKNFGNFDKKIIVDFKFSKISGKFKTKKVIKKKRKSPIEMRQ